MALLNSYDLPIGWDAPDFKLPNTEGNVISPNNFQEKKGLLVVFTCNHCPYAKASWPLVIDLFHKFSKDVGFLAVNPNDAITHPEDSYEIMKEKKIEDVLADLVGDKEPPKDQKPSMGCSIKWKK